ncbi:MAG TPA: ferritin family protein [Alphaproteobacteria bacterium]|nr:ferritin family protein [Alphaproteobacteria bacterium]
MGSLLSREPDTGVASLAELVGIAHAFEAEAVRRYDLLAREMDRHGAADTAATFRALSEEERRHVGAVAAWAERLHEPLPPPEPFVWRLPEDLAESWDAVAGSALLTPYRALAIAVTNEERAFAYYAYIAAHADEPRIAEAAEEMAEEELRHAMLLRRLRRQAYHHDRDSAQPADTVRSVATLAEFEALLCGLQRDAAREHAGIAAGLRANGEERSAALITELAVAEAQAAGLAAMAGALVPERPAPPLELLYRARAPLERLADACETVAEKAQSEDLVAAAQAALAEAVARLARLALQAERFERS